MDTSRIVVCLRLFRMDVRNNRFITQYASISHFHHGWYRRFLWGPNNETSNGMDTSKNQMNLRLYYPHKPYIFTQEWGRPDPAYEQFGFRQHNGIDAVVIYNGVKPKTWPVYCPMENARVHMVRFTPKGGGHEIYLISKEKVQMGDRLCYAYFCIFHNEKVFLKAGDEPQVGELISIADNMGFSTGSHTHCGLYRVEYNGSKVVFLDTNDANGSCDPRPYYTGEYAIDKASYPVLITNVYRFSKYSMGF